MKKRVSTPAQRAEGNLLFMVRIDTLLSDDNKDNNKELRKKLIWECRYIIRGVRTVGAENQREACVFKLACDFFRNDSTGLYIDFARKFYIASEFYFRKHPEDRLDSCSIGRNVFVCNDGDDSSKVLKFEKPICVTANDNAKVMMGLVSDSEKCANCVLRAEKIAEHVAKIAKNDG